VSFFFGTQNEMLYSYYGAGTALGTFTTEASLMGNYPACVIPGGIMANAGARSSSIKVQASILIAGTASPTYVITARLTTATPPSFSAGGTLLLATPAMTSSNAAGVLRYEAEIGLRTLAQGANSTVGVSVQAKSSAGLATPFGVEANGTMATWETDLQYFLWLSCTCSASNGANTAQLVSMRVYGED
jgi:hypothetical protein